MCSVDIKELTITKLVPQKQQELIILVHSLKKVFLIAFIPIIIYYLLLV